MLTTSTKNTSLLLVLKVQVPRNIFSSRWYYQPVLKTSLGLVKKENISIQVGCTPVVGGMVTRMRAEEILSLNHAFHIFFESCIPHFSNLVYFQPVLKMSGLL